jgi:hypothetical protein
MKLLFENWRKYLDEVERFPDIATSQEDIQKSLDYFYQEHAPEYAQPEDLGDWKGHEMVKFGLSDGTILFFAVDSEDSAKAYVAVEPFKEGYSVGNVRKTEGGGFYATDLYKWLVERFGSLYSDKAQTGGGMGIWARIPNKEKVETEKEDGKDDDGTPHWRWRTSK